MPKLSFDQIEQVAIQGGFPPAVAPVMAAIALAESAGDSAVIQSGQPYATTGWGLWQITPGNSEPSAGVDQALLDPVQNARAAYAKYQSQGLGAWTTYRDGKYAQFLPGGSSAVPASLAGGGTSGSPGTEPGGTYSNGGFTSALGNVVNGISGGLFNLPGEIVGAFADFDQIVSDAYNTARLFFQPSTYVRIGAGLAGTVFIVLGIVGLAREAKNS